MDQVTDASTGLFDLPPPRRDVPAWHRFLWAALGSLTLHGGVIAVALLLIGRFSASLPPPVLTLELAPHAQLAEVPSAASPVAAAAPAHAEPPTPTVPQRAAPSKSDASPATETMPVSAQASPAVAMARSQSQSAAPAARIAPLPASDVEESHVPAIEAHVLEWLARYRSYPRAARRAGIEGVVMVSAVMGRDGSLGERRIATSSGHPVLDRAALELLARASPVPPLPDLPHDVELHLPIVYRLNR